MTILRPIQRLLIANRGEIARRIIRTCKRLGIETVAVFTTIDADSPHVREATYSECIGAPESYRSIEAILSAARRSGADSIHPGYGFLSENGSFAQAVTNAGLIWVGPSRATIESLGSKTAAKALARTANVPIAPTLLFESAETTAQGIAVRRFAGDIGFPLIIKAAAGGGGRGTRFLDASTDIEGELQIAKREALKAFGSDEIFVEKCVTPARHIEVQIAGDLSGAVVALGTRDCSLQRGNQKIIEEAPALALSTTVRDRMYESACALARASGYTNLGTVEFLYAADGSFYFLEVNTRLQVEHPVTEAVTGLDLVELQLRIAQGDTLSACGVTHAPEPRGHAIEARLCAEEYTDRFITSVGTILELEIPSSVERGSVRADLGFEPCSVVSHHYDSLLGKIIVHAESRDAAIAGLEETLTQSRVSGVRTNRTLLIHLLRSREFRALTHSIQGTALLLPDQDTQRMLLETAHAIVAGVRAATPLSEWSGNSPWIRETAPDATLTYPWRTVTNLAIIESLTERVSTTTSSIRTTSAHRVHTNEILLLSPPHIHGPLTTARVSINGEHPIEVAILKDGNDYWAHLPSATVVLTQEPSARRGRGGVERSQGTIISSIPGKVAAVMVKEGDEISEGTTVLVLDSMKMEHPIKAPVTGKVTSLPAPLGALVQAGTVLAIIGRG